MATGRPDDTSTSHTRIELPARREEWIHLGRQMLQNRNARIGLGLLGPMIAIVIVAPVLPLPDPTATDAANAFASPSAEHWFGTDHHGRDLFARTLLGGRVSLLFGLGSTAIGLLLGVPIGLASGYFGGNVDEGLMRFMDLFLAFPSLLLALLILAVFGGSMQYAILAVGLVFTPRIARIVRGSTLSERNETYIEAAKARGESHTHILVHELLPNVKSPIIVEASIRIGFGILIGTSLSFLGLGAQPPNPDWGYMIAESRDYLYNSPWFMLWPGLFLSITVLGFNMLGDGLRDILNVEIEEQ